MRRGISKSSLFSLLVGIPLLVVIYSFLGLTLHWLARSFTVIAEFFKIVDSWVEELLFLGCPLVIPPLIFLVLSFVCLSVFILFSIDNLFRRRRG